MFRIFIFGATLASIRETQLYFSILADGPRATISVSEALCLRVRSLSVLRVRVINKVLQDYVLSKTRKDATLSKTRKDREKSVRKCPSTLIYPATPRPSKSPHVPGSAHKRHVWTLGRTRSGGVYQSARTLPNTLFPVFPCRLSSG